MVNDLPGKKLWFKAKDYGYGWTPVSWEGWVVIVVYVAVLVGRSVFLEGKFKTENDMLWVFIPDVFIYTSILLFICVIKGEKAEWRWRGKKVNWWRRKGL